MVINISIRLFFTLIFVKHTYGYGIVGRPQVRAHACTGNEKIIEVFEPGRHPKDENQFSVFFRPEDFEEAYKNGLPPNSRIFLTLDTSDVQIVMSAPVARVVSQAPKIFTIQFYETVQYVSFDVIGQQGKPVPNILKMELNLDDLCPEGFKMGIWDSYITGEKTSALSLIKTPTQSSVNCGRRKIDLVQLITNSQNTKYGDWPWHAAIYKTSTSSSTQTYICGGSLLSPSRVLTAGHCVVEKGEKVIPERIFVVLGKYNLQGGDSNSQENGVYEVILHENFNRQDLKNDIAILKLTTEVEYGLYVQPICLWDKNYIEKNILFGENGTVVGWGLDENRVVSQQLKLAQMPVASDFDCLRSHPLFFEKFLTENTFCAGSRNGTSACNGDSGGGMYFPLKGSDGMDTWHLRGIVSVSVPAENGVTCDPYNYVVFTDVARYLNWIEQHLK